ncbi:MAG: diaminopimelate epimerase [Melioribacteraceae bacterium]|nr:MAG: diaminopimelate epimerase [Melioribacteraceae bacterium]
MQKVTFSKYSGAGNDFVLIDKKLNPGFEIKPEIIINLCDRRNGIGADGVLLISDSDSFNFTMEYFNSDSSGGMLCANGARCALNYAKLTGRIENNSAKFLSNNVEYSGVIISENKVRFNLNDPENFKFNFKIKAGGQLINASYVNSGSPHVVINIDDILSDPKNLNSAYKNINEVPVFELGKEIRNHVDFKPEGANVNFIKIENGKIFIRSFERGVEGETLACGTGIVASALISFFNYKISPSVELVAKSGESLFVDFKVEDKKVKNVSLTGSAKEIFKGEILI